MTETVTYPHVYGRTTRYLLAAAALAAAVFALFWLTSSTASASYGGDGTQTTPEQTAPELPDSDNLDFGSYGASHFGIQYYTSRYSKGGVDACTGNSVFDGFAQTSSMSNNKVEDFWVVNHASGERERYTSASGNPCRAFVDGQNLVVRQMAANGGYHLRSSGGGNVLVLSQGTAPSRGSGPRIPNVSHGRRVDQGSGRNIGQLGLVVSGTGAQAADGSLSISDIPFSIEINTDNMGTRSGYICQSGFHPRGEDSASYGTESGSGRTLSYLTAAAESANWWCRSDVRYKQSFTSVSSGGTRLYFDALTETGWGPVPGGWDVPTGEFFMWGRKGCYYTALSFVDGGNGYPVCVYPFPLSAGCQTVAVGPGGAEVMADWLAAGATAADMGDCSGEPTPRDPDCDPDTDLGCPRPTRTCLTHPGDPDLNCPDTPGVPTGCVSNCGPPPVTPGDVPCVRHVFEIAENIVAGSSAQPGLGQSEQYQGRTGTRWDLQTVAPYTASAAPDRNSGDRF